MDYILLIQLSPRFPVFMSVGCDTSMWVLFRGVFRTLTHIYNGMFCGNCVQKVLKIVKNFIG